MRWLERHLAEKLTARFQQVAEITVSLAKLEPLDR